MPPLGGRSPEPTACAATRPASPPVRALRMTTEARCRTRADDRRTPEADDRRSCRTSERRLPEMSVAKAIEISASSEQSFEEASRAELAKAGTTVHGIQGAWINEQSVRLNADGSISEFRVTMR